MKTKKMILTAFFAALTACGAFLHIPLGVTSVTLQFLMTAAAGILLGRKCGALSQLLYVALGLAGLPVFTQGGGISYVLQPTFGFLLGLIPCAWVIGRLCENRKTVRRMSAACCAGLLVLYAVGLPYLYLILNGFQNKCVSFRAVCGLALLPCLPGDFLKIAAAVLLCRRLVVIVPIFDAK